MLCELYKGEYNNAVTYVHLASIHELYFQRIYLLGSLRFILQRICVFCSLCQYTEPEGTRRKRGWKTTVTLGARPT